MSRPSSRARGSSVFDRLCDSSLYTGAHKHRFDASGNGKGLAGRDRVAKGHGHIAGGGGICHDLSQITRTNLNTSGAGYAHSAAVAAAYSPYHDIPEPTLTPAPRPASRQAALASPREAYDSSSMPSRPADAVYGGATGLQRPLTPSQVMIGSSTVGSIPSFAGAGPSFAATRASYSSLPAGRNTLRCSDEGGSISAAVSSNNRPPSAARAPPKQSIFDRLTDPSQYTGAHKHRFDGGGYGRGAVGRTTPNAYVAAYDLTRRNC